jgi:hypothetical protein
MYLPRFSGGDEWCLFRRSRLVIQKFLISLLSGIGEFHHGVTMGKSQALLAVVAREELQISKICERSELRGKFID